MRFNTLTAFVSTLYFVTYSLGAPLAVQPCDSGRNPNSVQSSVAAPLSVDNEPTYPMQSSLIASKQQAQTQVTPVVDYSSKPASDDVAFLQMPADLQNNSLFRKVEQALIKQFNNLSEQARMLRNEYQTAFKAAHSESTKNAILKAADVREKSMRSEVAAIEEEWNAAIAVIRESVSDSQNEQGAQFQTSPSKVNKSTATDSEQNDDEDYEASNLNKSDATETEQNENEMKGVETDNASESDIDDSSDSNDENNADSEKDATSESDEKSYE